MSAASSGADRAPLPVWLLTPLAALMLYVATWPLIEIKGTKVVVTRYPHTLRGRLTSMKVEFPPWADSVYWPLHRCCQYWPKHNPLISYWDWCSGVLKYEAFPMWRKGGP